MRNKPSEIDVKIEELVKRKEEIQKKQLVVYSNNMSQQVFNQLSDQLSLVEMEIYHYQSLKVAEAEKKNDDEDGLII